MSWPRKFAAVSSHSLNRNFSIVRGTILPPHDEIKVQRDWKPYKIGLLCGCWPSNEHQNDLHEQEERPMVQTLSIPKSKGLLSSKDHPALLEGMCPRIRKALWHHEWAMSRGMGVNRDHL